MNEELKSCPFDGGEAGIFVFNFGKGNTHVINCLTCGCGTKAPPGEVRTKEEAMKVWNKRVK